MTMTPLIYLMTMLSYVFLLLRHRHLQIGRLLDIDLISEPPPPMYVSKVWESVWPEGAGRWGQDVTYLSQMGAFLHPISSPPSPQGERWIIFQDPACWKVVPSSSTFLKVEGSEHGPLESWPHLFLKTKARSATCWVEGRGIGRR